jgi:predicted nucleotidyltransferase
MPAVPSKNEIDKLLREVEERFDIPDGSAIALEGSLAEGVGNSSSDIDFVVISESDFDFQVIPTIFFIDQHRVEVRIRTSAEMSRQLAQLADAAARGIAAVSLLDEEVLDRCQRFMMSTPLRNEPLISRIRRSLPLEVLHGVIAQWLLEQARASLRCAIAAEVLGNLPGAVSWVQSTLTEAAKSWLARRGDTYLPKKWLSTQLARTAPDDALTERILALETASRANLEPANYLRDVFVLLRSLGLNDSDFDRRRLRLRKVKAVTTWQLGERIHLLKGRSELFALTDDAGRIWRRLEFGARLLDVVDAKRGLGAEVGRLLSDLNAMGLVEIAWRGAGRLDRRKTTICPPSTTLPLLSPEGVILGKDSASIVLSPLPPSRFAAAGMALIYVNMVIENAREDAVGALDAGQWRVFERSAKRMLRFACLAMMISYGITPQPPVEEVYEVLARLDCAPSDLRKRIALFEGTLVDNHPSAIQALSRLDELISDMRNLTEGSIFPSSFDSPAGWQGTLNMGFDWARLGAFLDAQFPLEQARDLIRTARSQDTSTVSSTKDAA